MARERSPAFQFYPREFLQDEHVASMTLTETGAYWRLCCYCWTEGSIPGSQSGCARLLRVKCTTMAHLWPAIAPCFIADPADPSRLRHPRLDRERKQQAAWRERQQVAGRDGALKRWAGHRQAMGRPQVANGQAIGSDSSPVSDLRSPVLDQDQEQEARCPEKRTESKYAYDGRRLQVHRWMHEDLARHLGGQSFDLLAWYGQVDAELESSGESPGPEPIRYLRERLYRDAKLRRPKVTETAKDRFAEAARAVGTAGQPK